MLRFITLSAVVLIVPSIASSAADLSYCPVAGNYTFASSTSDGATSSGSVQIATVPSGCLVVWSWPNGEGKGTYKDDVLTVTFTFASGRTGVVRYVRAPNGQLIGPWWMNDKPMNVGIETLTPKRL